MPDDPADEVPDVDDSIQPGDELDGCDIDFAEDPTADDEVELMPLFAQALDPDSPQTVEQAAHEWRELGDALPGRDS